MLDRTAGPLTMTKGLLFTQILAAKKCWSILISNITRNLVMLRFEHVIILAQFMMQE